MSRALLIAVAVIALAGISILGAGGSDEERYRVSVVFDTAKGMVAGQQVKIAGAVVGKVDEVDLVAGPKARMTLEVDREFSPFREDATCSIRPEGLISENFVECVPGKADGDLRSDVAGIPTIPVERTTVPVSLQDVIDVFALPTSDRLRVFLSELGIAGAGRGDDINAMIRRANPALASSRKVLQILGDQRDQLGDAVVQTDKVLDRLGRDDQAVRAFVGRAADVVETTAPRRERLEQTIARLPAMLREVRPGLRAVDRTAEEATPLLRSLRLSAPEVSRTAQLLPRVADAGRPALKSLRSVSTVARPAARDLRPFVRSLRRSSPKLGSVAPDVDQLLVSLRDTGGIDAALRTVYTLAVLASSYDETSHLINFIAQVAPGCIAAEGLGTDSAGCSRRWDSPGNATVPINNPACGPQKPENLWRNHRCTLPTPPVFALPQPPSSTKKGAKKRPAKPGVTVPPPSTPATPSVTPRPPTLPGLPLDVEALLEGLLGGGEPDGAKGPVADLLGSLLK